MKVLIVYYSAYGNVYQMANLVAEGVKEIPGVEPGVRTVPELIPKSVIDSREDMKAGREMQKDVPLVTMDDFREAGAIAFGTPTRFGNVSSQLKNQIDQLTVTLAQGRTGRQAGRCLCFHRQLARRPGNNDSDANGATASLRDDSRRCPVFHSGTVHHAGWRLAIRSGARRGR
jgi:multimeric flavodoxin WrbA